MQEVLKMNEIKEDKMTSYENLQLNMLLSYAVGVFDIFSDSTIGEYEAEGDDKDGRKIKVKVVITK